MSAVESFTPAEVAVMLRGRRGVARFDYADILFQQLKACRLPMGVREFKPLADRKFRLDVAWPERLCFAECDGGEWIKGSKGRHGGARDCERWNALTLAGWTGFRFVGSQVRSGYALRILREVLK
jgi:hypothetical protein